MNRVIKHTIFYAHPPETVWEYLTNSDLLALWLMKNNFQPVVGAEFQFRTGPVPSRNFDGIFYCKVLEIIPFKKLSYTWNCGPGEGKIDLDSVVEWKLEATDKGTNLYLEHSGFAKEENIGMYDGLNHGWTEKFKKIEDLLNKSQHGTINA